MIRGKPAVFISHSEIAKSAVAIPFREFLGSLGLYGIIVSEEPIPEGAEDWDPGAKVEYFLNQASMFVAFATPDGETTDGNAQPRGNIIDEIRTARERPHLKGRMQIFKSADVALPSNINPTYMPLDPKDVATAFPMFVKQARAYGILEPEPPEMGPAGTTPPEAEPDHVDEADRSAIIQAADALEALAEALRGEDPPDPGAVAARAFLASSYALATERSTDPLGVHEINGLYRECKAIKPTNGEISHLLRTIVANIGAANAPGWYWLRETSASEIQSRIATLAISDSDASIRRSAIQLLAESPRALSSGQLQALVKATFEAEEDSAVSGAISLLAKQGTRRDLSGLRDILDQAGDTDAVNTARLRVLSRESPQSALRRVLKNPNLFTEDLEPQLEQAARKLPLASVKQAIESPNAALRSLGLRLLNSVSKLTKAEVERIVTEDPEASVKLQAVELAISRRWRLPKEKLDAALEKSKWDWDRQVRIQVKFWSLSDPDDLLDSIDYFGVEGAYIYEALGRYNFDLIKDQIAEEIDTNFAGIKTKVRVRLEEAARAEISAEVEEKFGSEVLESQRDQIEERVREGIEESFQARPDLQEFILSRFRIAAMAGIAANGGPEHLPFARRFLQDDNRDLVRYSIELLGRAGTQEDIASLIDIATSAWGDLALLAAEAALDRTQEPIATALEFLEASNEKIVALALDRITDAPLDRVFGPVWALLRNDGHSIREAATKYLIKRVSRSSLQRLPDAYARGQYYYNVVTRVDRELYAPRWVNRSAQAILGD